MSEAVFKSPPENLEQEADLPINRFLAINEGRMSRVQQALSPRKQAFLDALPLLFHVNEHDLPGFVSNKTPFGIADYYPSGQSLFEARRIARSNKVGKKAPQKFNILGLYFMGSPGTIAYNGESDFDIWVFVEPSINEKLLEELQQKAQLIENWAAKSEIEVHFYIINPDRFRVGEMLPISNESSGSSQQGLLLDEFYRSSIKIAGLPLTWWMVPLQHEMQFEEYIQSQRNVTNADHPSLDKCINLGPLTNIASEEFFGAAIWQLNKSIKSPYKSVLKLLLMEVYAADNSGVSLISHQFKKRVYEGTTDIDLLDPWLLMFKQVEEYLLDSGDMLRLEILRRSFYLKVNEKLSQNSNSSRFGDSRQKLVNDLVTNWAWEEGQVSELDARDNWKLETVIRERTGLINTLTKCFRILTKFANENTNNPLITQADLHLLNRRLFSAFERKSGKIEIINRGISPDISEGTVSLHLMQPTPESTWGLSETVQAPPSWVLYRGIVTQQDLGDTTHLKRTSSLIEILAWCYFNKILDKDSKVSLYLPADNKINQQEIKTILEAFSKQFTLDQQTENIALSEPVRIISGAVFVNTGLPPKADSNLNDTLLSSQRSNALSYGGQHENLTKTFDLVFVTSWGETFIKHYSGTDALIDCITEYMSWAPLSQKIPPEILEVYCYSPGYGSQIRKTLNALFSDIVEHFFAADGYTEGRYIVEVEDGYQSIEFDNDVISHKVIENQTSLLKYLAKPASNFSQVHFGPYTCSDTLLPAIYAANKPEAVQIFFYLKDDQAKVHVLDEKGSLFTQLSTLENKHSFFGHYKVFADAIIERIVHNDLTSLLNETECVTEMYSIEKNRQLDGMISFDIEPLTLMMDRSENFLSLQVICDRDENHSEQYTIYCKDKEFSSLEYGESLFDVVAEQVMQFRGSRQAYPVHITDIDLSQTMLNDQNRNQFQSNQFFRYKKHIESKLTKALEKS